MIPHERSLVKRLQNKPFALLGVNSDTEARYRSAVREGGITWPNWFDGGSPRGPIATKWNVSAWPTVYIIDAKGVIRFKDHGGDLDADVDRLLAETHGGVESASPPDGAPVPADQTRR